MQLCSDRQGPVGQVQPDRATSHSRPVNPNAIGPTPPAYGLKAVFSGEFPWIYETLWEAAC